MVTTTCGSSAAWDLHQRRPPGHGTIKLGTGGEDALSARSRRSPQRTTTRSSRGATSPRRPRSGWPLAPVAVVRRTARRPSGSSPVSAMHRAEPIVMQSNAQDPPCSLLAFRCGDVAWRRRRVGVADDYRVDARHTRRASGCIAPARWRLGEIDAIRHADARTPIVLYNVPRRDLRQLLAGRVATAAQYVAWVRVWSRASSAGAPFRSSRARRPGAHDVPRRGRAGRAHRTLSAAVWRSCAADTKAKIYVDAGKEAGTPRGMAALLRAVRAPASRSTSATLTGRAARSATAGASRG